VVVDPFLNPSYLYRVFSLNKQLLYVGLTRDLTPRFRQQARTKPDWHLVGDIQVTVYADRSEAEEAERVAIQVEDPLWNIQRPTPLTELDARRARNEEVPMSNNAVAFLAVLSRYSSGATPKTLARAYEVPENIIRHLLLRLERLELAQRVPHTTWWIATSAAKAPKPNRRVDRPVVASTTSL
jgi:hypothetical protein